MGTAWKARLCAGSEGGALGLRAQLEPNKAGLGCPGLENPINGQNPPFSASQPAAGLGFQRNNSELGVKDVKAAPQPCN